MAVTMIAAAARCSARTDSPKKTAPITKIVGNSTPPATALRAAPIAGAAAAYTNIGTSAQKIPIPITQLHPPGPAGTTRSAGIVTISGASAADAPSETALSRSNGSSRPSRSVRIATPSPKVAGAMNSSGEPTVPRFGPNASASFGGVTVQPALALPSVGLHDLAVVPLLDTTIGIDWRLAVRDDPDDDVTHIANAIRSLVSSSGS